MERKLTIDNLLLPIEEAPLCLFGPGGDYTIPYMPGDPCEHDSANGTLASMDAAQELYDELSRGDSELRRTVQ